MRRVVRAGGTPLHIGYGSTYTNNLRAFNTSIDIEDGTAEIVIDLDPNLRARNTETGSYDDAADLADEGIDELRLIHFPEADVANEIGRRLSGGCDSWLLTVNLDGQHSFRVVPEWQSAGLFLRVIR